VSSNTSGESLSADQRVRDERSGADRCWIWRDSQHYPHVAFTKPEKIHPSVEYMRVLTRGEVERLANDTEGVDAMQMINSLHRTIEGQRKHIKRLQEQLQAAEHELGMGAGEPDPEPDSFRKLGIRESDFLP